MTGLIKKGNKSAAALGTLLLWLATVILPGWKGPAFAHIYKYIDSEGVVHFTNAPTTRGVSIYIREEEPGTNRFSPGPSHYDPIIRAAGKKYRLDTALIKAVIQAESNFNPRAVSSKGARGLMQIMPENNNYLNISNAFDPSQNIMAGTRYLRILLDRYENKLALALAAYNAGPTAVDRYKQIPPFPETQNYVQKVMVFYDHYKRI